MRIVVVGAGIVGAAVAYECARAGAEVLLLDKSLPASGVTGDSFAWIGGPRGADPPDASTPLRRHVLADHRRLENEVAGVRVHWRGCLTWGADGSPGARLGPDERLGPDARLGPDERLLDAAQVAELEPHLRTPPARALHLARDGAVDPVAVTQALVRAAQGHGARLETGRTVTALALRDGRLVGVQSSAGFQPADVVVVAAGVDAPVLCAPLGLDLPVTPSPALLVRLTGPPGLVRTLVAAPDLEVREVAAGQLLVAAGHDGEVDEAGLQHAGERVRRRLATAFGAPDLALVGVRVGARPMPADGLPVVGPVPGVRGAYLAVMHSGVTLAPTVGRLVAAELVTGVAADELAGLRPARFRSPRPVVTSQQ